jgi:hypothetical protein
MAKKPILAQESFAELPFPSKGIDISRAFGSQQSGTTPVGVNVRAYEPGTSRNRGGSRPGLDKYIAGQLPTAGLVQELNTVVIGTASALLDNIDDPGYGSEVVLDPSSAGPSYLWATLPSPNAPLQTRNPGRIIRRGGHGRQSNKNRKPSGYVQGAIGTNLASIPIPPILNPLVLTFPGPVTKGNLLISVSVPGNPQPTDTQGNAYIQAVPPYMDLWYAIAKASGPCTVTVAGGLGQGFQYLIGEYKGLTGTPIGQAILWDTSATLPFLTTGPLATASAGGMLLVTYVTYASALFASTPPQPVLSTDYPFTIRQNAVFPALPPLFSGEQIYYGLALVDGRVAAVGAAITGTVSNAVSQIFPGGPIGNGYAAGAALSLNVKLTKKT